MRFKIFLFIFCGIAAIVGASQASRIRLIVPKGATSFTSKSQGFAAWFPTQPSQIQRVVRLPNGENFTTSIFQTGTRPVSYIVMVSPKPARIDIKKPTGPLDAMQRGFVKSSRVKVKGKQRGQELQLNGFPGRELEIGSVDGVTAIRVRLYLTPKNSYQLFAHGAKAAMQKQSAQVERVFDSFLILPQ